jgi:hypothetical protein
MPRKLRLEYEGAIYFFISDVASQPPPSAWLTLTTVRNLW